MGSEILWSEIIFLCDEISLQGNQVTPVVVKISNYTEKMKNKTQWYSSPFFTFKEGYKIQIRVDPAVYARGNGEITHDHVFVYLLLLKGPHDNQLVIQQSGDWPIKGTFTVELLNQLNDSNHRSNEVAFTCNAVTCNFTAAKLYSPAGHSTSHKTIYQITSDCLQNDSLYFRISYKDTRYDYYYYYHLIKYVLLPTAAGATLFITGWVMHITRFKKVNGIIMHATGFIVGSLLVGNLLGGVLWGVLTILTLRMILIAWKRFTGKNLPNAASIFAVLVISIPTNILVVDAFSMLWNLYYNIDWH